MSRRRPLHREAKAAARGTLGDGVTDGNVDVRLDDARKHQFDPMPAADSQLGIESYDTATSDPDSL